MGTRASRLRGWLTRPIHWTHSACSRTTVRRSRRIRRRL